MGDYFIPIGGADLINNRTGQPWWDALHAAGVATEVYRIPGNYPPTPSEALTLSGMGTVDMRGGYGVYTWFTDQPLPPGDKKGDVQLVTVEDYDLDGAGDTVRSRARPTSSGSRPVRSRGTATTSPLRCASRSIPPRTSR